MRNTTRHIPYNMEETPARGDGFVLAAIVCAAVMVAIFALNGGPNLLGERFDASAIAFQSP